jgi:predicted ATPase
VKRLRAAVTVGREEELEALRHVLDAARAGRGRCLLIRSEPGAGKTRLLLDATAAARKKAMSAATAASPATGSRAEFGVLAEALRSLLRGRTLPSKALAQFAPGIRQIIPEWPHTDWPSELSPSQVRLLALEGALRLLTDLAGVRGCLLALDDIHAADAATIEFVHHAASVLGDVPVALVATMRSGVATALEAEVRLFRRLGGMPPCSTSSRCPSRPRRIS